jgi:hypothetical protein
MKKTEMCRACSRYVGGKKVHTGFSWENLRKGDHLEYPSVWEDNIKIDLQDVGWENGLDRSGSG